MRNPTRITLASAAVLSVLSTSAFALDLNPKNNKVDLNFRYRIETVSQDGIAEDATASTLRSRLAVNTSWTDNLFTMVEFEDVTAVVTDDYNAGAGQTPERSQYPVIADGQTTEVNQAFIGIKNDSTTFKVGRQRINIGNQRFVGGVGWRQDEQTYDSMSINHKFNDAFALNYTYVFNVNRIFDQSVAAGKHKHETHLINGDYKLENGKLSGYYFSVDNQDAAGLSNTTFGIRYDGKVDSLKYAAEFASQSDAGDNTNDYSANYYLLDATYNVGNASFGLGYEVLGGDVSGGQGFTTSLATLHKFQGWADVFLATPAAGVDDLYLTGAYKVNGYKFKLVYHDFSFDEAGGDIGTEVDFVVNKKFSKNLSGLLKFASFSDDSGLYSDRDKTWFMLVYKI